MQLWRYGMKHCGPATLAFFAFACCGLAGQRVRTFQGEVLDSQCAKTGGHEIMVKRIGARDEPECVRDCVSMGGVYVLYDASTKSVYQLDDQRIAARFGGHKVKVAGTFDKSTNTIHFSRMDPAT